MNIRTQTIALVAGMIYAAKTTASPGADGPPEGWQPDQEIRRLAARNAVREARDVVTAAEVTAAEESEK